MANGVVLTAPLDRAFGCPRFLTGRAHHRPIGSVFVVQFAFRAPSFYVVLMSTAKA
jgi:hypothetical protein